MLRHILGMIRVIYIFFRDAVSSQDYLGSFYDR